MNQFIKKYNSKIKAIESNNRYIDNLLKKR